ncbi:unnamed protein product [Zymoseptoria tritici ST99CH_1A5]|uniref:Uncharacterized protein n=1 Tax=Zymoseptoria tritici ST99CH_1A5 TaxID=1276529 RepID=A0A1Y6M1P5_ZYMTR|nr:unnamed protein product [Zymoseptoria tritici ST99CH_1A5]
MVGSVASASVFPPIVNIHTPTPPTLPNDGSNVQPNHTIRHHSRDMSRKRKSPELPDDTDTLITKRRRLLGNMLGSAPSTADPPPDSLDT